MGSNKDGLAPGRATDCNTLPIKVQSNSYHHKSRCKDNYGDGGNDGEKDYWF